MANGKHETSRSWLRAAKRDNKIAAAFADVREWPVVKEAKAAAEHQLSFYRYMMEEPQRLGRPTLPAHLQRVNVPLRLPCWLVDWITRQDGTRADVIERALIRAYKLKEPK